MMKKNWLDYIKKYKEWINLIVKCSSIVIILLIIIRHLVCFNVSVPNLVKFSLIIGILIQIQGLGLLRLLRIRMFNYSVHVLTGFFVGVAAVIVEYFLSVLMNTNVIFFIAFGLSVFYFFSTIFKHKHFYRFSFAGIQSSFFVLVALMLILSMMDYQLTFIRPDITPFSSTYQDYLYHMSLVNSISHGYPIVNPELSGEIIHYHFFYDLISAIPVKLIGLSSKFVLYDCMPYLNAFIFSLALYSIYRKTLSNSKRNGIFAIITLCAYAGLPLLGDDILLRHIVTNVNAFGLGTSSAFCFITNLIEWEMNSINRKDHIHRCLVLCVLIALIIGIKAPIGLVIIAGLWGSFTLGIFYGKFNLRNLLSVLAITICGILVYAILVGTENGGGATIAFYLFEKATTFQMWNPFNNMLITLHIPAKIRTLILRGIYVLFLFGIYNILFLIAYVREVVLVLYKKKPYQLSKVTIYAMIPIAITIYEIVLFPDYYSSEIYFLLISSFLVPIITIWYIDEIDNKYTPSTRFIKVLFVVLSCIAILSMRTFFQMHLFKGILNSEYSNNTNPYDIVSHEEYEAMCWIKDHTPENALLAVDHYHRVSPDSYSPLAMHNNTFFGYSAYSQRNCYLEGSGYTLRVSRANELAKWATNNDRLFDPLDENRGELAKGLGIDYIVVSKRLYKSDNLENETYTLCFSNKDIDIYKIKK